MTDDWQPPPRLAPEQVAELDRQETEAGAELDRIVGIYMERRLAGQARGTSLLGMVVSLEQTVRRAGPVWASSMLALAAVRLGDKQLRAEGFED